MDYTSQMPEDTSAFQLPETVLQLVGTKQAFPGKERETLYWGWADSHLQDATDLSYAPLREPPSPPLSLLE